MRAKPDLPEFWGYEHAANWHFINIEAGSTYLDSAKHPRGDAYTALLACSAILQGRMVEPGPVRSALELYLGKDLGSPAAKTVALKFLLHLAADLHQPLHLGYPEDRGGNDLLLEWKGRNSNLHAVWDSGLFSSSLNRHLTRLSRQLADMDPAQRRRISQATPAEWISQGLILRDRIYQSRQSTADSKAYTRLYLPVAEEELIKAALRSAWLLNSLFAAGAQNE